MARSTGALEAATKMKKTDVSTPLDATLTCRQLATLTCRQLEAEIALRDQQIVGIAMRMNKVVANQLSAAKCAAPASPR
ncbi:hypothetical protein IC614_07500 [Allosphingosinicella flava]|uniref:Uncharacterized protein n=1 Tax=Allosphingosinicella flava TaxID=2771430 RepID=A0A7T2GHY3_9SPHN|nr:hypothetical protein [Sphingosinicella flava]QPQ54210.1 hypothetical protein IC614_07500 [Sphingosinicella flava]